jgi:tRNA-specific 2-thiouridylase
MQNLKPRAQAQAQAQAQELPFLVALSGSTASFLAASLIRSQGHDCKAVHLRFSSAVLGDSPCKAICQEERLEAARLDAKRLSLSLEVIDLSEDFAMQILDHAIHQRILSRDFNPCLHCRTDVLLPHLFEWKEKMGCSKVVLGLHARIRQTANEAFSRIYRSLDPSVDESFYLYNCSPNELADMILPLGEFSRLRLEKLAQELKLEIVFKSAPLYCFNRSEEFNAFLTHYVPGTLRNKGVVRVKESKEKDGFVTGNHDGLVLYHHGQETGFPKPQQEDDTMVVLDFEQKSSTLIIAREKLLAFTQLQVSEVNLVCPLSAFYSFRCHLLVQSQKELLKGQVRLFESRYATVTLEEPMRLVFPGMGIFFYREDELLGGGIVKAAQ